MKKVITITYKNGEKETLNFKELNIGGAVVIVPQDKDKNSVGIRLKRIKEINIK